MANQEAIDAMVQTAFDAGCPRDQVETFLSRGYVPLPWQWEFHAIAREADLENGPVDIGAGGARGPGKSHAVLSQAALDDCQRVPRLKGLFLRQTGLAAEESFDDLIMKAVHGKVPYIFNRSRNFLAFPNGSKILLGGFKDERDIEKYIGIEYDIIIIEERNQLPGERIEKLRGSLRTTKSNWRPRIYSSFNPGGKGHADVKKRFIEPYRMMMQTDTRFVPATYKANPHLKKEYIDYLEGLTGDLGKAWREGEWDLFAGQFFPEWKHNLHVIQPFAIPHDWKRIVMGDYGYSAPAAVYWGAISPDDILYIYRELYGPGRTYKALCEEIISLTPDDEQIEYWVFDPAIWAKDGKSDGALSGAEIMQQTFARIMQETNSKKQLRLLRGNNERVAGWTCVRERLKPKLMPNEDIGAGVQVFSTCPNLITTLPALIHDEHKPEDCDSDLEDHGPDALRYGCMSNPTRTKTRDEYDRARFNKIISAKRKKGIIPPRV
jgi:phage terminase large subunit